MAHSKTDQGYEVIICGDSFFAVWTSILLFRQGVKVLRLHNSASGFDSRESVLDVAFSTLVDPPTRALVAHGKEVADYLCQFVAKGAVKLAREFELQPLRSVRLAVAEHEQRELIQAARDFPYLDSFSSNSAGDPVAVAAWAEPASYQIPGAEEFSEMVLKLEPAQNRVRASVVNVEESSTGVVVRCDDGQARFAELCVLGQGAAIANVVTRYASILVPVTDVRVSLDVALTVDSFSADPLCFRAASGHISGCLIPSISEGSLRMNVSGPRYALFHAGAGWHPSDVASDGFLPKGQIPLSEKTWAEGLAAVLPAALRVLNPALDFSTEISAAAAMVRREGVARDFVLGTLPCDELPLLGEFGSHGRLLGNAGWIGVESSAALPAAEIICDLILHGCSKGHPLHPRLSPRRFQTV
jgi:hypothetical protein